MKRKQKKLNGWNFIKSVNILWMTIPFIVGWYSYYAQKIVETYFEKESYLIIILFMVLYTMYGKVYDTLPFSMSSVSEQVYSQGLAAVISDVVMYIVICILMKCLPNIFPLVLVFLGQLLAAVCWSIFLQRWYVKNYPPKRTVVIYGNCTKDIGELFKEYGLNKEFMINHVVNVENCIQNNLKELQNIDAVFFFNVHSSDRNFILKFCIKNGIEAYVVPRIGDLLMSNAKQMHMFHLLVLKTERYNPSMGYLVIKRFLDVFLSCIVVMFTIPVMIFIAVAIYATDKGPILYRQRRLTKDGKEFEVLKFRSMRMDAEKDGIARLSTGEKDDRVTPIGRILRKSRMDELPQLFNILKGDMSIVGPRPERPEIAKEYEKNLPEFSLRLQVKAGLTGYAQVYGKYNTAPYDKLQMDLMYIARPSILEDLRIMFATVKILFLPESTEGVGEGQIIAKD